MMVNSRAVINSPVWWMPHGSISHPHGFSFARHGGARKAVLRATAALFGRRIRYTIQARKDACGPTRFDGSFAIL